MKELTEHKELFLKILYSNEKRIIRRDKLMNLNSEFYENVFSKLEGKLSELEDDDYEKKMETFLSNKERIQYVFSNLYGEQESIFLCLNSNRIYISLKIFKILSSDNRKYVLSKIILFYCKQKEAIFFENSLKIIFELDKSKCFKKALIDKFSYHEINTLLIEYSEILYINYTKIFSKKEFPKRDIFAKLVQGNKEIVNSLHILDFFKVLFPDETITLLNFFKEIEEHSKNYNLKVFQFLIKEEDLSKNTSKLLCEEKIIANELILRGDLHLIKKILNSNKENFTFRFLLNILEGVEIKKLTHSTVGTIINSLLKSENLLNEEKYVIEMVRFYFNLPKLIKEKSKREYQTSIN